MRLVRIIIIAIAVSLILTYFILNMGEEEQEYVTPECEELGFTCEIECQEEHKTEESAVCPEGKVCCYQVLSGED